MSSVQSVPTPSVSTNRFTLINGEPAVALEHMPESWQRIAQGTWLSEPQMYTAMAQVFLAKHQTGQVLFLARPEAQALSQAYCEGNGQLAWEAVEYFGEAFLRDRYPDFEKMQENLDPSAPQKSERLALIKMVRELFNELRYDVPSTFYWTFLHPLQRADLFEVRSFRFSEQDLTIARQFDAILHGGYVTMLRRFVDSVSSRYGFFIEHGCGCENHLAKLKPCDSTFEYTIPVESRQKVLRAFFWSVMEEYLFFEQRAATRLVYADSL